jgi:hypothetical protein
VERKSWIYLFNIKDNMKRLDITPDIERHLISILDAAFKGSGLAIADSVQAVRQAVVTLVEPAEPPKTS